MFVTSEQSKISQVYCKVYPAGLKSLGTYWAGKYIIEHVFIKVALGSFAATGGNPCTPGSFR